MKHSPGAGSSPIQRAYPGFSRNSPQGATKVSPAAMPWTCPTLRLSRRHRTAEEIHLMTPIASHQHRPAANPALRSLRRRPRPQQKGAKPPNPQQHPLKRHRSLHERRRQHLLASSTETSQPGAPAVAGADATAATVATTPPPPGAMPAEAPTPATATPVGNAERVHASAPAAVAASMLSSEAVEAKSQGASSKAAMAVKAVLNEVQKTSGSGGGTVQSHHGNE